MSLKQFDIVQITADQEYDNGPADCHLVPAGSIDVVRQTIRRRRVIGAFVYFADSVGENEDRFVLADELQLYTVNIIQPIQEKSESKKSPNE